MLKKITLYVNLLKSLFRLSQIIMVAIGKHIAPSNMSLLTQLEKKNGVQYKTAERWHITRTMNEWTELRRSEMWLDNKETNE